VAKKGANRRIFEGNTPPKKMYPQKWPFIDGHSMKAVKGRVKPCTSVCPSDIFRYQHIELAGTSLEKTTSTTILGV
jgi:hypothetical protein